MRVEEVLALVGDVGGAEGGVEAEVVHGVAAFAGAGHGAGAVGEAGDGVPGDEVDGGVEPLGKVA